MGSTYQFPHDDYALSILTQAAMHSSKNTINSTSTSSFQQRSASKGINSSSADLLGFALPSTLSISNQQFNSQNQIPKHHSPTLHQGNQSADVTQTSSTFPDHHSNDYNNAVLSTRSMETLRFNPTQAGRQHQDSYLNSTTYHSIGSQISSNFASTLGILNAESYDDGSGALRAHEAHEKRVKSQKDNIMPFGLRDSPVDAESDTKAEGEALDGRSRRRKKPRTESQSADDDDEARKKARGRPRVDTKDETAADRRRTQIRMAQRAYRNRKETTISTLEKQVQELRGTTEEMNNIFITLYDFAVGRGLLQREPEFGHQLQTSTEKFLALAKASVHDDSTHEDTHNEDDGKQKTAERDTIRKPKGRKPSPKKQKEQESSFPASGSANPWGGYTVSKDDSPIEEVTVDYQQNEYSNRGRSGNLEVITRPTEDNASFPFDFMDFQQFRVEVPSTDDFARNFLPHAQPPLPETFTYTEFSFARRIHRNTAEKALQFLTSKDPPSELMQRTFGICLMYETKDEIIQRCKNILAKSTKETMHQWRSPFLHIGGAGTYYPIHEIDVNAPLMPKFKTNYSMGPFTPPISDTQQAMKDDMRCSLPGFEGTFFDATDVEGYLRGHGIEIPPSADFVTAEVDMSAFTEVSDPQSATSSIATVSPRTPQSPNDIMLANSNIAQDDFSIDFGKFNSGPNAFSMSFTEWDTPATNKEADNIDPMLSLLGGNQFGNKASQSSGSDQMFQKKRMVTLNIAILIEELSQNAVCLGRSPGFRPSDVNGAIIAAVKAGFS